MIEKTWTNIDKSTWSRGPWDNEPDKTQFVDKDTGMPCLAVRNDMGVWCGYVGVDESHPHFGADYNEVNADVHGGLTFSDFCSEEDDEGNGICHVAAPGEDRVFWFGFDCCHSGDLMPNNPAAKYGCPLDYGDWYTQYRTLEYVKEQCALLAAQLFAMKPPVTAGRLIVTEQP